MKLFCSYFHSTFLLSLGLVPLSSAAGTSLSYHGVTIQFAQDQINTGKFANGEPWIVGPLTVTGIINPSVPASSSRKAGAMINPIPGGQQGFMPHLAATPTIPHVHGYNADLDVSRNYPFNLAPGDSLIVGRAAETDNPAVLMEAVVGFTVLAAAPPAGSFRPGLYGKDRRVRFNMSDIDWSVLRNLAPVPATPSQEWMEAEARLPALPLWEWGPGWEASTIRPLANSGAGDGGNFRSNYGREIAFKWSYVALWLNTNNSRAVKEKVMIQAIQSGIDIASYFDHGQNFHASGGHQVGFKFPMLLAAATLKDPDFIAYASTYGKFVEDLTTFFVQQSDVGRVVQGGPAASYIQSDVGMAEWGITHMWDPWKDDRRWRDGVPYRFAQWPSMTGQVLAAELMGLQKLWNHPPIFPYSERHTRLEGLGNGIEGQMWNAYKADNDSLKLAPPTISPKEGNFFAPQTVTMQTNETNAQIRYTLNGTMPTATSLLYSAPISVSSSQTIRATVIKNGRHDSEVSMATLVFPLRLLSPANWTLEYVNSEHPGQSGTLAFDGNPESVWITEWKDGPLTPRPPHEIQINLGSHHEIDGFSYLPRQDTYFYGDIGHFEFYVSVDGVSWGRPVAAGYFPKTITLKEIRFPAKNGQYVRLRALSASDNGAQANIAELGVSVVSTAPLPPPPLPTAPKGFYVLD